MHQVLAILGVVSLPIILAIHLLSADIGCLLHDRMPTMTVGTPATYLRSGADILNSPSRMDLAFFRSNAYESVDALPTDFVDDEGLNFRPSSNAKYVKG